MKRFSISVVIGAVMLMMMALSAGAAGNSVTVQLQAQNNSGESGTATLTDMGNNQTKVTLNLSGAPAGVAQPAHIHEGTCANLNPTPKYPLTNVMDGKSDTTVNVSLSSIMTGGFAINVHKSAAEVSTYFSCGNIPASSGGSSQVAPQTGAGQSSALLGGIIAVLAGSVVAGGLVLRRRTTV
jgi:hypothetical protein